MKIGVGGGDRFMEMGRRIRGSSLGRGAKRIEESVTISFALSASRVIVVSNSGADAGGVVSG